MIVLPPLGAALGALLGADILGGALNDDPPALPPILPPDLAAKAASGVARVKKTEAIMTANIDLVLNPANPANLFSF